MRWHDLKWVVKWGVGMGSVILLTTGLAVLAHLGIGEIISNAGLMIKGNQLRTELLQHEVDHQEWVMQLNRELIRGKELTTQVDHRQCGLGKWYNREDRSPSERFPLFLKPHLATLATAHTRLHQTAIEVQGGLKNGRPDEAREIFQTRTYAALKEVKGQLSQMRKVIDDTVISDQQFLGAATAIRMWVAVAAGVAVVAGILLAILIAQSTAKPLHILVQALWQASTSHRFDHPVNHRAKDETGQAITAFNGLAADLHTALSGISQVVGALAKGELNQKVTLELKGSLGELKTNLNTMVDAIAAVARKTSLVSGKLLEGSKAMAARAEDLAQGAANQAASVEQASAAIEEMGSTIQVTAENAAQTEKIAAQAASHARKSFEAVLSTVKAMKEIAQKITIIQKLADQTNLLALNAAIEAARAGDYGKGFAVVADEVRKLAEGSEKAANEINLLSTSSVQVAEEAGKLLERLVPDILKTAELVREISASTSEQRSGAAQINTAMQQLDQVVQRNSASADQSAAMAEELSTHALLLQDAMDFFKLDLDLDLDLDRDRPSPPLPRQSQGRRTGSPVSARFSSPPKAGLVTHAPFVPVNPIQEVGILSGHQAGVHLDLGQGQTDDEDGVFERY